MVYVFLADGFEIIEALAPVDMLTRAKIDVKTVGVTGEMVTSSCGVQVKADMSIDDFDFYDVQAVVLPGGMPGTLNLENNPIVGRTIDNAVNTSTPICAICAAPSILGHKGLLKGKEATCFPGYEKYLYGADITGEKAVVDGKIITGKGAGAAADFGFAMLEILKGKETADKIKEIMQY